MASAATAARALDAMLALMVAGNRKTGTIELVKPIRSVRIAGQRIHFHAAGCGSRAGRHVRVRVAIRIRRSVGIIRRHRRLCGRSARAAGICRCSGCARGCLAGVLTRRIGRRSRRRGGGICRSLALCGAGHAARALRLLRAGGIGSRLRVGIGRRRRRCLRKRGRGKTRDHAGGAGEAENSSSYVHGVLTLLAGFIKRLSVSYPHVGFYMKSDPLSPQSCARRSRACYGGTTRLVDRGWDEVVE
jgi:hypothetical protein